MAEPHDDSDRLKRCAHCGAGASVLQAQDGGYFIECDNPTCGMATCLMYATGDDPVPLLMEKWNRRPTAPLYDADTPPVGLFALRDVIRCLRETGSYTDDEGEATNALEDLLDRLTDGVRLLDGQTKPLSGTAAPLVSGPVQVDAPLPPTDDEIQRLNEASRAFFKALADLVSLGSREFKADAMRREWIDREQAMRLVPALRDRFANVAQLARRLLADRRQRAAEQPDTQQPQSVYQTEPFVVCTVQTALPMALVPREPTPEMMTAVDDAYGDGGDFEDMWRAAIAAAPAAGNQSAREAFEAWFSDSGEYPLAVQRNGEGYYLMQAQSAWAAWDAAWRAYRAAHATGAAA